MEIEVTVFFFLLLELISLSSHSCHLPQVQLFFQLKNVIQKPAPSRTGLLPVKYTLGSLQTMSLIVRFGPCVI